MAFSFPFDAPCAAWGWFLSLSGFSLLLPCPVNLSQSYMRDSVLCPGQGGRGDTEVRKVPPSFAGLQLPLIKFLLGAAGLPVHHLMPSYFVSAVLGIKPSAWCMLGKHCTTEPHPRPPHLGVRDYNPD